MDEVKKACIILNDDFAHFFASRHRNNISINEDTVKAYIDQYIDTQVGIFCINTNASLSYTPSKVIETVFDKYLQKKANGEQVDFSNTHVQLAYQTYVEKGLDVTKLMISQLQKNNIKAYISIRMNDLHGSKQATDNRTSNYRTHAIENQLCRTTHRSFSEYYDFCFDYSHEEIRNRMLQYIDEQLEQYDVDGIELDFLREVYCFKIGNEDEGREIINDMIRHIKKKIDALSNKRNRKIKMMVRVPSNPIHAYDFGFDVYTWASEKLVDYLIVTPRFTTCDSTIPLRTWVRMFEHTKMEIIGGLEALSHPKINQYDLSFVNTPEMANGYVTQYLSAGTKKVYLYNYFDDPALKGDINIDTMAFTDRKIVCDEVRGAYVQAKRFYQPFLKSAGSLSTLQSLPRRHILTYSDIAPQWIAKKAKLPFTLEKKEVDTITVSENYAAINTGEISLKSDAYLLVGINSKINIKEVKIWCNNIECKFVRTTEIYPYMTTSTIYVYQIPNNATKKYRQVFEFYTEKDNVEIDYLEVRIFPNK